MPIFVRMRVHAGTGLGRSSERCSERVATMALFVRFYFPYFSLFLQNQGECQFSPAMGWKGKGRVHASWGLLCTDILPDYYGCSAVLIIYNM